MGVEEAGGEVTLLRHPSAAARESEPEKWVVHLSGHGLPPTLGFKLKAKKKSRKNMEANANARGSLSIEKKRRKV